MPTCAYRGTPGGQHREGEIDATDQRAALTALRRSGVNPLWVVGQATRALAFIQRQGE